MNTLDIEFKPDDFDHFVGQADIKERLRIAVKAAKGATRPLDTILLEGPPGTGKTTMAWLLADMMGTKFVTVGEPPTTRDLLRIFRDLEYGIVLLDEIQDYPKATKNALLPMIEAHWFGGWEFDRITAVAATTNPEMLPDALLDRFDIVCRYADYNIGEMAQVVEGFADKAGVELRPQALVDLARAAGGQPRVARSLVIAARDLIEADEPANISTIMRMCNRLPDGLSTAHLEYLRILDRNGRRAGLETLVHDLGKHRTIVNQLERLLVDRKYIRREATGRELTQEGQKRLQGEAVAA